MNNPSTQRFQPPAEPVTDRDDEYTEEELAEAREEQLRERRRFTSWEDAYAHDVGVPRWGPI